MCRAHPPLHRHARRCGLPRLIARGQSRASAQAVACLRPIDRMQWTDSLAGLRRAMRLPVCNDTRVLGFVPAHGRLHVRTQGRAGEQTLAAHRIVLAGGYEDHGIPRVPPFVEERPRTCWAHSSGPVDFAAPRRRRVGVLPGRRCRAWVARPEGSARVRRLRAAAAGLRYKIQELPAGCAAGDVACWVPMQG